MPELVEFYQHQPGSQSAVAFQDNNNSESVPNNNNNNNSETNVDVKPDVTGLNGPPSSGSASISSNTAGSTSSYLEGKFLFRLVK
jgi:hypothetical protein